MDWLWSTKSTVFSTAYSDILKHDRYSVHSTSLFHTGSIASVALFGMGNFVHIYKLYYFILVQVQYICVVFVYVCMCLYVRTYVCMFVFMCLYVIYMCVCMVCVCMCMCVFVICVYTFYVYFVHMCDCVRMNVLNWCTMHNLWIYMGCIYNNFLYTNIVNRCLEA